MFIYSFQNQDNDNMSYRTGFFNIDTDIKKEFSWIKDQDWIDLYSFTCLNYSDFFDRELPYIIYDLVSYYGWNNIFMENYSEGFSIKK